MILKDPMQEDRKKDHIDLTNKSQVPMELNDPRFFYEPLFATHPDSNTHTSLNQKFLGKTLSAPFWVSSMTGGVGPARHINQNLATITREFGLGMGLGSCRTLLESDKFFEDFNLRPIIGGDLPFFANLGIAQLDELLELKKENQIFDLMERLETDGLIIHVNPLQEWYQPEGDRYNKSALEIIQRVIEVFQKSNKKIIVKEVGQGFGPRSLKALLALDISAIDLAGFGGTNFSRLEILRDEKSAVKDHASMQQVGHTSKEMIEMINHLGMSNSEFKNKEIIISGGVKNFLDAHYLTAHLKNPSIVGMARNFLNHGHSLDELRIYTNAQIEGLKMARAFLDVKNLEL